MSATAAGSVKALSSPTLAMVKVRLTFGAGRGVSLADGEEVTDAAADWLAVELLEGGAPKDGEAVPERDTVGVTEGDADGDGDGVGASTHPSSCGEESSTVPGGHAQLPRSEL
jgi:hypothetical protein